MEITVIVSLSAVFLFELVVILFKFKLFDPYKEKKEKQANPDVVALKEQYYMLEAARKRKWKKQSLLKTL